MEKYLLNCNEIFIEKNLNCNKLLQRKRMPLIARRHFRQNKMFFYCCNQLQENDAFSVAKHLLTKKKMSFQLQQAIDEKNVILSYTNL